MVERPLSGWCYPRAATRRTPLAVDTGTRRLGLGLDRLDQKIAARAGIGKGPQRWKQRMDVDLA